MTRKKKLPDNVIRFPTDNQKPPRETALDMIPFTRKLDRELKALDARIAKLEDSITRWTDAPEFVRANLRLLVEKHREVQSYLKKLKDRSD